MTQNNYYAKLSITSLTDKWMSAGRLIIEPKKTRIFEITEATSYEKALLLDAEGKISLNVLVPPPSVGGGGEAEIDDSIAESFVKTWSSSKLAGLFSEKQRRFFLQGNVPPAPQEEDIWINTTPGSFAMQLFFGGAWTDITSGAAEGGVTGPITALDVSYNSDGNASVATVQDALQLIESTMVSTENVYTKQEVELMIASSAPDYNNLTNKPDLSALHTHENLAVLAAFSEMFGRISYNDSPLGDMVKEDYDANNDGIIDLAASLNGLTIPVSLLNFLSGATGNIQSQINALSSGTVFRGEYATYADMTTANATPGQGDWVFVTQDETKSGAYTQYYYDGTEWIYGGGAAQTLDATSTTKGSISLAGVLGNPASTADNPLLADTGVAAGTYDNATVTVSADGRITSITAGDLVFVNDTAINTTETWSSNKINSEIGKKADSNHGHTQLHNANMLGSVELDTSTIADRRVIVYDAVSGKAKWMTPASQRVYVGSQFLSGDYKLEAGSLINLIMDQADKTITINAAIPTTGDPAALIGYRQITKLGVTASISSPKDYSIPIEPTTTFLRPPLEVLHFVPGATDVLQTQVAFDNSDETDFLINEEVLFDGAMKLKKDFQFPMVQDGAWGENGSLFYADVDLNQFKMTGKFSIE